MYFYIGILTASLVVLTNAGKTEIAGALIDLGGKLLIDEHGGTNVHLWEIKGQYVIESECWEDGGGMCPNGNCLDHKGRRGTTIKETSWKCSWACFFAGRNRCRYQICCPFHNKRPHTNGGNGGNPSTGIAKTGDGWRFVESTVKPSTASKAAPAGDHTKCCATCQAAAPDTTMYIFNKNEKRCYCRKPLTGVTPVTIQENGQLSKFCKGNTGYESLGCWKDTGNRAIATLEGIDSRLTGSYQQRKNAVELCFEAAKSRGYPAFAVQHGGWCAASSTALETYKKYGAASNCADGKGGGWANDVYKIQDSREKRLCSSTDGCSLEKNTLLTVLPQLKKEFSISFEFQAREYMSGWQSVIHLTEEGNCCKVGQRIPALWVSNAGQLHPCFAVDGNGNYNTLTNKKYSLSEWHHVQFSQSLKNGKYMYRVIIDGETVLGPVENRRPESFSNVKVYAADPWYNSLKGSIRNLIIITDLPNGWEEIPDGACYEDDNSRLLDDFHTSSTNTPNECKRTCASRGYVYAGVQYTNQCFCGDAKPPASRVRDSSQCNQRCPGDSSLKCGGSWRMNIYTTG